MASYTNASRLKIVTVVLALSLNYITFYLLIVNRIRDESNELYYKTRVICGILTKSSILETISMENEDQFLYSHVEDEDFDERQLNQMEKTIKTQHPQVFRYFKELGRHHPNLAKTIAEALFTGIRQTGEEMGEWRFI